MKNEQLLKLIQEIELLHAQILIDGPNEALLPLSIALADLYWAWRAIGLYE